jgi:hypothetical protein
MPIGRSLGNASRTASNTSSGYRNRLVDDNWRRVGLGTMLTKLLAQRARLSGVRRLCGDILEDNLAVRRQAHSLGARLSRGMGCVRLCLDV